MRPVSLAVLPVLALCVVAVSPASVAPASAHGENCEHVSRTKTKTTNSSGVTHQSTTMTVRTYWQNCANHTHPENVALELGSLEDAGRLDRIYYDCTVRNDDYEDRALRWSGSLSEDRKRTNSQVPVYRAWRYPTHPRTECTFKAYWDSGTDDEFEITVMALR